MALYLEELQPWTVQINSIIFDLMSKIDSLLAGESDSRDDRNADGRLNGADPTVWDGKMMEFVCPNCKYTI